MNFFLSLKDKNDVLFWFGFTNLIVALVIAVLSFVKPIEFAGTNAWHKPLKFALSTSILTWSLAWYTGYLPKSGDITVVNWVLVVTLGFEVLYIALQASKGQASHYNRSSPFYSMMFSLMALAATIATFAAAYIGIKFFTFNKIDLPDYYLWGLRFGFILFTIFSLQGFVMGSRLAHTVGSTDGSRGLPFLNWSLTHGDLRIAHFIGMHALQILPLLAWGVLKSVKLVILTFILYMLLALFLLIQALAGNPIVKL